MELARRVCDEINQLVDFIGEQEHVHHILLYRSSSSSAHTRINQTLQQQQRHRAQRDVCFMQDQDLHEDAGQFLRHIVLKAQLVYIAAPLRSYYSPDSAARG